MINSTLCGRREHLIRVLSGLPSATEFMLTCAIPMAHNLTGKYAGGVGPGQRKLMGGGASEKSVLLPFHPMQLAKREPSASDRIFECPNDKVGLIIGKGGSTHKRIEASGSPVHPQPHISFLLIIIYVYVYIFAGGWGIRDTDGCSVPPPMTG